MYLLYNNRNDFVVLNISMTSNHIEMALSSFGSEVQMFVNERANYVK